MKHFHFRLDRLLNLRSQEETEKARELSRAIHREEEMRGAREAARARLERCQVQAGDPALAATPAGLLRNLNLTVNLAADLVEAAEQDHRASANALDTVRDEFGEARKERHVIERLRERRHDAWMRDESREEQKECDGVAQQRWIARGES
jgi:flagellar FliJ protein